MTEHTISFRWVGSYRDEAEYEVFDGTRRFRIDHMRDAEPYDPKTHNYTPETYAAERTAIAHTIRAHNHDAQLTPAHVAAFNAYKKAEHEQFLFMWKENPNRYGPFEPDSPRAPKAPIPVRGVYWHSTGNRTGEFRDIATDEPMKAAA